MGALAKALLFPGANTLVMNLICSFSDGNDEAEQDHSQVENFNEATWISLVFFNQYFIINIL
jgi:hypothetical protein